MPNSKILSPGELNRGQSIIVLENYTNFIQKDPFGGSKEWSEERVKCDNISFKSVIYEILGVDLPFVSLKILFINNYTVNQAEKHAPYILDSRSHDFMEVSDEFLKSLGINKDKKGPEKVVDQSVNNVLIPAQI